MTLPACINCGKKIGKHIYRVSVPFDASVEEFIATKYGTTCKIVDKLTWVWQQQRTRADQYAARMEEAEEARLTLTVGSNRVSSNPQWAPSILERTHQNWLEDRAKDPPKKQYGIDVRIWRGEYGYDCTGLFHSGACARAWGTAVALELRKKGKI